MPFDQACSVLNSTTKRTRLFDCRRMRKQSDPGFHKYWDYVQAALVKDGVKPWAVIRHEHVMEDICCVLGALGLQCRPENVFSHRSKDELDTSHCNVPEVNATNANLIDIWNKRLNTRILKECSGPRVVSA